VFVRLLRVLKDVGLREGFVRMNVVTVYVTLFLEAYRGE